MIMIETNSMYTRARAHSHPHRSNRNTTDINILVGHVIYYNAFSALIK